MNIIWLCLLSLFLTAAVWFYLKNTKKTESTTPAENIENTENTEEQTQIVSKRKSLLPWYCLIILIVLCGLSVALTLIYPTNTLLQNIRLLILIAVLFAAAWIDKAKKIIPNQLILAAIVIRVILYIAEFISLKGQFWDVIKSDLIAMIIPVFFLLIGAVILKGGIGMGDIKLLIVIALYQGLQGALSSVFAALLVAFVISVFLLITKKKGRKDTIPFAPSVLIGTIVSVFLTGM